MLAVIFLQIHVVSEKSWVSVQNHLVPVQKPESLGVYVTSQLT